MSSAKPHAKRIYLINRDFQLRYTRLALLVGLGSTALTLVLILTPLFQFRILRFPGFLPTPFLIAIAVASVLNFVIVACMGVLITHRIAGPMFSVVRHLRRIQHGGLRGQLKVREGDDLKYLVRNLNELIDYLVTVTAEDRERAAGILAALSERQLDDAKTRAEALVVRLDERLSGPAAERPAGESA